MKRKYIYVYVDMARLFEWKVGKADENKDFEITDSSDVARNRVHQQLTAATSGDYNIVAWFDITKYTGDSIEVEAAIHKALKAKGFVRKLRRLHVKGVLTNQGNTEWFQLTQAAVEKSLKKNKEATEQSINDDTELKVLQTCIETIELMTGETGLPTWKNRAYQQWMKSDILELIDAGEKKVYAELAARFGKTGWGLDLFVDGLSKRGYENCIIPAYYLSACSSFAKEVKQFDNFSHIHVIDTRGMSKGEIDKEIAQSEGKFRLILMSLCKSTTKFQSINELSKYKKVAFIDEADFGAHTKSSKRMLDDLNCNLTIPMTGSNLVRAIGGNADMKGITFSYNEMLMVKNDNHPRLDTCSKEDRQAAVDSCKNLVNPIFLKANWSVPASIQEQLPEDFQVSWTKIGKDVEKARPLIESMMRSIYLNDLGGNIENADLFLSSHADLNVSIHYGTFKNKGEQGKYVDILRECLGDSYEVIMLNGNVTSNSTVEAYTKDKIALAKLEGKKVIISSWNMGTRSYSVSEIATNILCYDKGDVGATQQKIGRTQTPGKDYDGEVKTSATIVSLSFDANRTSGNPIDAYILEEAMRICSDQEVSLQKAIKVVCLCQNVFATSSTGPLQIETDNYAEELVQSSSFLSTMAACMNYDELVNNFDESDLIGSGKTRKQSSRVNGKVSMDISGVISTVTTVESELADDESGIITDKEAKEFLLRLENFITNLFELKAIDNFECNDVTSAIKNIQSNGLAAEFEQVYRLSPEKVLTECEAGNLPLALMNTVYPIIDVDVDLNDFKV